jgi:UDP-N-acetylglucosamine acyltransferase
MEIHSTALVSPKAELAEDVKIEAYSIIGPRVTIGSGTVVGPHAIIDGWTIVGERNQIFAFSTIGYPPQDLSYRGEETQLVIGNDNIIREYVTVNRGTQRGGGVTRIGNHNLLMAYAHVAHDCAIGNYVILANATTLGGHVRIDDHAILGGLVAIHQFIRIGTFAFIGGKSGLRMDMPPYMLAFGAPAKLYGPNLVGLRRHGLPRATIQALKNSYRIMFRSGLTVADAIATIREEVGPVPEVENLIQFMLGRSKRGVTRL